MERIAELKQLFRELPDSLTFRAIQALIDTWPKSNGREEAVALCEGELANWPWHVCSMDIQWSVLECILASPSWPLVRHLRITLHYPNTFTQQGDRRLQELVRRPELRGLKALTIFGDGTGAALNEDAISKLAASEYLTNLNYLALEDLSPTPGALNALAGARFAGNIRELSIASPQGKWEEGWKSLFAKGRFPQLERLHVDAALSTDLRSLLSTELPRLSGLTCRAISRDAIDFLVSAPLASKLKALDLAGAALDDGAFAKIARSPDFKQLRELRVSSNGLGPISAALLSRASFAGQLTDLNIGFTHLGNEGVATIAVANWPSLRRLGMQSTFATDDGLTALAKSNGFPELTELNLTQNEFTSAGGKSLASAAWLGNLQSLAIGEAGGPGIGDEGAVALAAAAGPHLTQLDLSESEIGSDGAIALATKCSHVRKLVLTLNEIGPSGAEAISTSMSQLRELELVGCDLRDAGFEALSKASNWTNMRSLAVSYNQAHRPSVETLLAAPWIKQLWVLVLDGNPIGPDPATLLNAGLPHLIQLGVTTCGLDANASLQLAESAIVTRLDSVSINPPLRGPWLSSNKLRPVLRETLRVIHAHP